VQVNGPREAGRYNLSVALLGTAMMPDSSMNMGEAEVEPQIYSTDHHGVSFMLQHMPVVRSVLPSRSGMLGGARLTITGESFSTEKHLIKVSVAGTSCRVEMASMDVIVCTLEARSASSFVPGTLQPGPRGVRRRLWFDAAEVRICLCAGLSQDTSILHMTHS